MKANQAFKANDEAVSPVIGVILMVAITVVLAAVVFVLVTKLSGNQQNSGESASVSITSPTAGRIYVTLVSGGQNSPYAATDLQVTVDSNACGVQVGDGTLNTGTGAGKAAIQNTNTASGATSSGRLDPGETMIVIDNCAATPVALASGSTHLVSVTVHGTLLNDNTKVVIS